MITRANIFLAAWPAESGPLEMAGLADLSTHAVDLPDTLAQVTDDAPVILLSHSPDVFPEVPERLARALAGQTVRSSCRTSAV